MNLYELAHHPESYDLLNSGAGNDERWWGCDKTSTKEQFDMMNFPDYTNNKSIQDHTDENEFRMHLLFVHWATLPESE